MDIIFDYYLRLLFVAKKEFIYLILGISFNIVGIPGLIEGIRGVRDGQIFLGLKRHRSVDRDTREGVMARLWGIFYIVVSLIIICFGYFMIWVFIASYFKH